MILGDMQDVTPASPNPVLYRACVSLSTTNLVTMGNFPPCSRGVYLFSENRCRIGKENERNQPATIINNHANKLYEFKSRPPWPFKPLGMYLSAGVISAIISNY
jgi:hypothetical protein